jgi:hypothetical protein
MSGRSRRCALSSQYIEEQDEQDQAEVAAARAMQAIQADH